MASQDWLEKDFYQALGVAKSATQDDIKKAYRKLARKYHPDQNSGDKKAEEKFKEISEAYQVLSNEEDRRQYDAIRAMGAGGARFSAGGSGSGGFDDIFSMFNGAGFNGTGGNVRFSTGGAGSPGLDDILSQMFGGGSSASGGAGGYSGGYGSAGSAGAGGAFGSFLRRPQRGKDVTASISLPLRDAVSGATVKVGSANGRKVTAKIPAGVADGQKIRIAGKGGAGQNGGEPGDILVTVHVEPHPVYELKGKDVYVNVPVSFDEAALGATIEVPTLQGDTVRVKIPAGSSTDKLMRVKGKGLSSGRASAGNMFVRVKVVVPKKLSEESRAAVEAFRRAAHGADPRAEFREMAQI
ncbi:MAG: DnaJ C-terminal domain-containing protein [Actinomycetaceae bacterium]|nr:DnaJ C-terminal domain-containing protein [Actinomycetaceae bacterium]MDY5272935.1 DnaJ C-terminal domain-containing protein [Arcanobacterium sp.]